MISDLTRDVLTLIARIVVGVTFIAHGLLKIEDVSGAIAGFGKAGIPLPSLSYWFTILVELGGGAAMIIGAALPLIGVLFAVVTLGALVFVHGAQGFYVHEQGYEFVLVLAVTSLALSVAGDRFALDAALARRSPAWARLTGRTRRSPVSVA
ncbi:DoxX family protein [Lentzea sp. JNUCC 0626]|uniref:DoxX family protein n=1 Tax=Lentzea sp. JNUCC 0626 TaxID=3367513 RepID=UPI00374A7143